MDQPGVDRDWLTVVEAATLLGVSELTVRRAVANGTIPHMRLTGPRGTIRIPRSELARLARAPSSRRRGPR